MAVQVQHEKYSHAVIDCGEMTLTEYVPDHVRTYSITEILKRWNGIPEVEIEIRRSAALSAMRGEEP